MEFTADHIRSSQPIAVVWFNAEAILLVLRQDPEVARLAAVYLRWSTLGLPAYAFNSISRRYFQSQGASSETLAFGGSNLGSRTCVNL